MYHCGSIHRCYLMPQIGKRLILMDRYWEDSTYLRRLLSVTTKRPDHGQNLIINASLLALWHEGCTHKNLRLLTAAASMS